MQQQVSVKVSDQASGSFIGESQVAEKQDLGNNIWGETNKPCTRHIQKVNTIRTSSPKRELTSRICSLVSSSISQHLEAIL